MKEWTDKERLKIIESASSNLMFKVSNGFALSLEIYNTLDDIQLIATKPKEFLNANIKVFEKYENN